MVVAIPVLLRMPAALLRVVPGMVSAPAFPALSAEVFASAAGLWAALAVAGDGVIQFCLGLFDVVLALGAIFVGSRRRGASTQKNGAQRCACECDFSILCIQDFLPEQVCRVKAWTMDLLPTPDQCFDSSRPAWGCAANKTFNAETRQHSALSCLRIG
jgi:hypothetical protein